MKKVLCAFFLFISLSVYCQRTSITGVVNDYTPVLAFNPCENQVIVEDATRYNAGDTVLLIQMKGAVIDISNTASFGTITDYKNAGNYEFNYIQSKTGNVIEFKNKITRQYDIPEGKVQLIRVPYYENAEIQYMTAVTCLPWDGSKGGVVAINVRDTFEFLGDIEATGKGFRGGAQGNNFTNISNCFTSDYSYPPLSMLAAQKGEGIATIVNDWGKGALANGGGGGQDNNSGGGGGGNAANGGQGGYQYEGCLNNPFDNGGRPGKNLPYSNAQNKIFMGGGGGSGHTNNIAGFQPSGGNGGGIIIVTANVLNAGLGIVSYGNEGDHCIPNAANDNCNVGMGGGAAGGTILLKFNTTLGGIDAETTGGNGGNVNYIPTLPGDPLKYGPGGGGSGGVVWISQPSIPIGANAWVSGGAKGTNYYSNDSWGATAGQNGIVLTNLQLPIDNVPFKKNIDSVRINENNSACRHFDFNGFGFTNTDPIFSWEWHFGDGNTANTQNTSHTYLIAGTYSVKLIVTDINGCKDSLSKSITTANCTTATATPISNIINDYTPVLSLNPCNNTIAVEDASHFNIGDTILVMQMKGAIIDSTNTAIFGDVTDYKNAGNYEYNYVKNKTGNIVELKNKLTRQYDIPTGKVQLIRVPYYTNVTAVSSLTCLPWDGSKGGVLVFNVADSIILNSSIDVSGKGFRGGNTYNIGGTVLSCDEDDYYFDSSSQVSSRKGEGIADIGPGKLNGRGHFANGGGGGNGHNSGGGGGSNAAVGGFGGYELYECSNSIHDNRGLGGIALNYSNALNKVYLGGGGGGGHKDGMPTQELSSAGGNGGGIIIVNAKYLKTNNVYGILANGSHGRQCDVDGFTCLHDGMGGGGGGGSILLKIANYLDNHTETVLGGKGADIILWNTFAGHIGPGGGGGGGIVWYSSPVLPANATVSNTGGANGTIVLDSNNPFGSEPGQNGYNLFDLVLPADGLLFKTNIDSVRIKVTNNSCPAFDFNGFGYTNTNPVASWDWHFGDGGTANTQNTSHTYPAAGTYPVTLIVTDINGCKDSITKNITTVACTTTIINDYAAVLALDPCSNKITVDDATKYNVGDTVLLIQMKGAIIDSANTSSFGTITNYKNAGNYEFNYVKSRSGNIIELKNILTRQYTIPGGKVQLVRVPYYNSYDVNTTLTCLPWDGSKGGVLVLNAKDTVRLNADINTTAKGFLKGIMRNSNLNAFTCGVTGYYFPDNTVDAAGKGEGITFLSTSKNSGNGPAANGGGGGMNTNSGGGGGGNGSKGGRGGYEWNSGCPNYLTSMNWGYPGFNLNYNTTDNKIFMGGGGGAGHCNDQYDDPTALADYNGGSGGAIVLINANYIQNNGNNKIISKGDSAYQLNVTNSYITHDGMGGGGAGGTLLLNINNYINNIPVDISGGDGSDVVAPVAIPGFIGPGGGGGGGVVWVKQNTLPANLSVTNAGGVNGVIVQGGHIPYGAEPGSAGINVFSLSVPVDNVPFKKNIDSVRIQDNPNCLSVDFNGLGYTNTNPVSTWDWYFGDAATAHTQNTSHTYAGIGTFLVKLVVTDINGCKDSITKNVTTTSVSVDAGRDSMFCSGPVVVQLHGIGNPVTGSLSWAPAVYLNNNTIPDPIATINATTTFYLTITDASGCKVKDSVTIKVNTASTFIQPPGKSFCLKEGVLLDGANGNAAQYLWSPATYLNNASVIDPFANPPGSTSYTVKITDTTCHHDSTFTVVVTVKPLPVINAARSNDIDCAYKDAHLSASGAVQYTWTPTSTLSDPSISNPVATPTSNTDYIVTGTDIGGCKNKDTVSVLVKTGADAYAMPNSFTPNGDGHNDCFNIKHWGDAKNVYFIIYNRFGEKVFESNNVSVCWDGTYKGMPADPGTYVFYIRALTGCGEMIKKGNVVLIR